MKNRKLLKGFAASFVCLLIASSFCTVFADVEVNSGELLPEMTKQQRLEKTVYLQNLNYAAACDGILTVIRPADKSVTPIYNEDKFYIPLRFVLEYYGVGVSWEHETRTVIMQAGEREYRLSTKDSVMSIGENEKQLENSCIIISGTTYVAFDDIDAIIGCNTYYFENYKSGVITAGEAWNPERQAEKEALDAMEFAVSPFFKMFV
jgi:hypothetical protein